MNDKDYEIVVNVGTGEIIISPGMDANDVPQLYIRKLKEPVTPGTFVSGNPEYVGVPIAIKFHSLEAINYLYRMLAPLVCEYHVRECKKFNKEDISEQG